MASSSDTLRVRSWLPGLVGMLGMSAATAGTELIADLELAISPPLPAALDPGATGTLQLTLTNNGPDDAGFVVNNAHPGVFSSLLTERPDGSLDVYFFPPDVADNCVLRAIVLDPRPPFIDVLWGYVIYFPPLPADESVTCSLRFTVNPDIENQQIPVSWTVRAFTEMDPNPDNDLVELVFNVGGVLPPQPATPVPSMNIVGIGLLMLGVFGFGVAAGGGRRRRDR